MARMNLTKLNRITGQREIDAALKLAAKTTDKKSITLNDGGFLILKIETAANATPRKPAWQIKRGDMLLQLGTLDLMSLDAARTVATEKREQMALGLDAAKEQAKAKAALRAAADEAREQRDAERTGKPMASSFGAVATEYHAIKVKQWRSKNNARRFINECASSFKPVWHKRITLITKQDIKDCLAPSIAAQKWEKAKLALNCARQVLEYACTEGTAGIEHNVAVGLTKFVANKRPAGTIESHPALDKANSKPHKLGELLRFLNARIDADLKPGTTYDVLARAIAAAMVKVQVLTWQRPHNTLEMCWEHIDANGVWHIPADEMKKEKAIDVPLSKQVIALIKQVRACRPVDASRERNHVFATHSGNHIQRNSAMDVLRDAGFAAPVQYADAQLTEEQRAIVTILDLHGMRSVGQSIAHEYLDARKEWTETQLAHAPAGSLGATYDRALYLKQRAAMMQQYADLCDKAAKGGFARDNVRLAANDEEVQEQQAA